MKIKFEVVGIFDDPNQEMIRFCFDTKAAALKYVESCLNFTQTEVESPDDSDLHFHVFERYEAS